MTQEKQETSGIDRASKIAALAVAIVGLVSGVNTYQINEISSQLSETEMRNKWDMKVYELVVDAVSSGDTDKLLAVEALNNEVTSSNVRPIFKRILQEKKRDLFTQEESTIAISSKHISQSSADDLSESGGKKHIKEYEATPDLASDKKWNVKVAWADWDIDVFWCESSGVGAKTQAQLLKDAILNDGSKGRVRVRLLPENMYQRMGKISGYEIRPNKNEVEFANQISEFVSAWSRGSIELNQKFSTQNTPWYVSIFICPNMQTN